MSTRVRPALAALVALTASLTAACSSSGSGGGSGAGTGPATSSGGGSAKTVAYDGPEASLPSAVPAPTKKAGMTCRIGYMNISAAQPVLVYEQKAAQKEASRLGCSFIALDDQLNLSKQVDNFDQLLAQKVSAILCYPIVASGLKPSIAKANAAKVPVIAQNAPPSASDAPVSGLTADILQGFDTGAYLRAKEAARVAPGGTFALMGLAAPVAALQYLTARTKYWSLKFGLHFAGQIDAQQDNAAAASTAMSAILAKYRSAKVVFTYNDDTSVAAGTVARTNGAKVAVIGNNGQSAAFQAIKSGQMDATIQADLAQIGIQQVDAAYDALTGVTVPKFVVPKVKLINSQNLSSSTSVG